MRILIVGAGPAGIGVAERLRELESAHGEVLDITMVSADARRTLVFYRDLLGLPLVKRTVNFDDPGAYHLYFGVGGGKPGTILTFFEWPSAQRGGPGIRTRRRRRCSCRSARPPRWCGRTGRGTRAAR